MAEWVPDVGGSSDDSGVELRSSGSAGSGLEPAGCVGGGAGARKNKRKSSEPRHRREVLQMKKFRWDSDASSDTDRPSSGDSGIRTDSNPDLEGSTTCFVDQLLLRGVDVGKPTGQSASSRQTVIQKPCSNNNNNNRVKSSSIRVVDSRGAASARSKAGQSSTSGGLASTGYNNLVSNYLPDNSEAASSREVLLDLPRRNSVVSQEDLASDNESVVAGPSNGSSGSDLLPPSQRAGRNYKSMSRQRRIEANARERTRVHTISAAFESLRRAVPAYADNQKLSKLAILRIASAYILALACLNDQDYSRDGRSPSFSDCVDLCTKTIQSEGKARRRSKESLDVSS